jgi:uncharacterized protein (DUF427 family)
MQQAFFQHLGELRYEPTEKRVRALLGDHAVVDTTRALLVWEPRRVVASYAVPVEDLDGELSGAEGHVADERPILDPRVPFAAHSMSGRSFDVVAGGRTLAAAAFAPDDAAFDGYVALDFHAFDTWYEEDEAVVSHPRDPFHRVDVRRSSRHVRVELDGQVLAESNRPSMVFETSLPVRHYLPPEDVDTTLFETSPTVSACAYKGIAAYRSLVLPGRTVPDLAWTYADPLPDAVAITGLLCFFEEHVDMIVDGVRHERPVSPWSANRQA